MSHPSPTGQLIHSLLAELGITEYRLFLLQEEGSLLPDGNEAVSGFVLDISHRVYGFWLAFDEATDRYVLQPFYEVTNPEKEFRADAEYRRARASLFISRGSPG